MRGRPDFIWVFFFFRGGVCSVVSIHYCGQSGAGVLPSFHGCGVPVQTHRLCDRNYLLHPLVSLQS